MHTNQKCEQKHEDIVPSQTLKKKGIISKLSLI